MLAFAWNLICVYRECTEIGFDAPVITRKKAPLTSFLLERGPSGTFVLARPYLDG